MKFFWIFYLTAILAVPLTAQHTLKGKVVDKASGEVLAGASIILKPSGKALISQQDGHFQFSNLNAGKHQLIVSYIGFASQHLQLLIKGDTTVYVQLSEEIYLSEEVVVKSTRVTQDNPITFSVLSREDLQSKNQGTDLPYLLQSVPSVVTGSDAGAGVGYTSLRIRGTDLTRINVTLNGVPVNDPESHGVFFVNLPDLASSVENIQIQRGVGTSTNGAAAFGASMNIQTSDRSATAFAGLNSSFGSFNSFKNTLEFATGINKNGFALDGRLSKITTDGFVDRGSSDLKSFYLAGSWANKNTIVKLLVTGGKEKTYQAWYGIPKDSLTANRKYNPAGEMIDSLGNIIGYYNNQTDNYQQDYYQLHIARQINSRFVLNASLFLTNGKGYYESWKNNQKLSDYGFEAASPGMETIKRTDLVQQKWLDNSFYGGQMALNFSKNNTTNITGIGWNNYEGDHFGFITWARFAGNSFIDKPWYFNAGKKTDFNIFNKTSFKIIPKLTAFVDLQYRYINYSINGKHEDLADLSQNHIFNFVNPKLGFNYQLNQTTGAYASVALSNREPNRSVYRDADPDQDIRAEKLTNFELGLRINRERLKIETNLFYMDYTDQLVLTGKINNVGSAIMTNVNQSYRAGWESMLGYALTKKMNLNGNLTLSTNKIIDFVEYVDNWNYWDDPDNEPYQYAFSRGNTTISFSPAVTAALGISWNPTEQLAFQYQSQYVGRQYIDNTMDKSRSLDAYHLGNIMLAYDFRLKNLRLFQLALYLNNVFDEKYETNAWVYRYYLQGEAYEMNGYFPQAGFHASVQLKIGF